MFEGVDCHAVRFQPLCHVRFGIRLESGLPFNHDMCISDGLEEFFSYILICILIIYILKIYK